jgi:hypothetical protein
MKPYFSFAGLLCLLGAAGCQTSPLASVGWNFQVGRPSTLASPATVQQTQGPLTVGGVASGPMAIGGISTIQTTPGPRSMQFDAAYPVDSAPSFNLPAPGHRFAATAPPAGACDLDDVCHQLDRIEQRLEAVEKTPPARPLPMGPAQP